MTTDTQDVKDYEGTQRLDSKGEGVVLCCCSSTLNLDFSMRKISQNSIYNSH